MKYYKQETNCTCAVACARMMMSHFGFEVPDEAELALKLGTNVRNGTHPNALVALGCECGLEVSTGYNGSLSELKTRLDAGEFVLLFISVDVPHCVALTGYNGNHVFFNDPFFGENLSKQASKFVSDRQNYPQYRWRVWQSDFDGHLPGYDFSSYESTRMWLSFKLPSHII